MIIQIFGLMSNNKVKFLNVISDAIALPNFHVQIRATRLPWPILKQIAQ